MSRSKTREELLNEKRAIALHRYEDALEELGLEMCDNCHAMTLVEDLMIPVGCKEPTSYCPKCTHTVSEEYKRTNDLNPENITVSLETIVSHIEEEEEDDGVPDEHYVCPVCRDICKIDAEFCGCCGFAANL